MEGDPNILSTVILFLWVPVSLWGLRRWPPAKATAIVFLTGLLFLPEVVAFKVPGIPEFDKHSILALWLMIGIALFHRERLRSVSFPWQFKWCIAFLLLGCVMTVLLNQDPLQYGSSYVPGHVPYDVVHFTIEALLMSVLPFVIGITMFRGGEDLRALLRMFVVAAVLYSGLQIVEMILSPQMHRWVYGFHQHGFGQTMRGGGFRPMVFMGHGIALAMFTSMAVVAATALHKVDAKFGQVRARWVAGYLWFILAVSRSVAALLYSFVTVPLVLLTSPRTQVAVAAALAGALMLYPALRASDLIPIAKINEIVLESYGHEKVGSLGVRFKNEAQMLDKAKERLAFGWGGYCRPCVYEPWSGELQSVRDGAWIIALGDQGLVGFVGRFGLLVFPIFVLFRRIRSVPGNANRRLLAALALMIGIAAFDLIPNGTFNALALLCSGAMYGSMVGVFREAAVTRQQRRTARLEAARRMGEVPAS
ncbi:MAG: hypothetical protein WBG86_16650 [Polyangiales bacterium]